MGKFGPKIQNCLCNMKFGTQINSNFNGDVHFFYFRQEISFLGKFAEKNQTCQFKLKLGTWTNLNMLNSMVMLTLSVFNREYPFCVNLVQEIKIVSVSSNLVPRLICICRIQWWVFTFSILDWKYTFLGNLVEKTEFVSLS